MADAAVAGMGSEFDAEQRLADETRRKQEFRLLLLKKELKAAEKVRILRPVNVKIKLNFNNQV